MITLSFIASPLVAASFKEPRAIQRGLAIVPLGAIVATVGIQSLWVAGTTWRRAIIFVLFAAALVQFSVFYRELIDVRSTSRVRLLSQPYAARPDSK
jgi:hypothetical protein